VTAWESLEAGATPDDWEPVIRPLKHMAWMLPALDTAIAGSGDRGSALIVGEQLNTLLSLEDRGVTPQRGLEASIAQGFKVDARLNRNRAIDERVLERLKRTSTFWYSQVNLLHAVTLGAAHGDRASARSTLARFSNDAGAHPFVRATATLCTRALDEAAGAADADSNSRVDRYVWDDEGVVVSRAPRDLADEAIQLFGEMHQLPYCIQSSRDRSESFIRCAGKPACHLGYCPLRPAVDLLSAHREISRAFCRHQRSRASPRTAKRLWGSAVGRDALRDFWRKLESRARF
jgi:hypothetical protein